jgi:hypothetical protein
LIQEPKKEKEEEIIYKDYPTYMQYGPLYRAHWILCASGFSTQLMSALVAIQGEEKQILCEELIRWNGRNYMNIEALCRFLNVFMDNYNAEALLNFFGDFEENFIQSLVSMIGYEPMRDVVLRILNEVGETRSTLYSLTKQLLEQLFPTRSITWSNGDIGAWRWRFETDQSHQSFARMIHTCDLLTDLLHEKRIGSIGLRIMNEIVHEMEFASTLVDNALEDLQTFPQDLANESYGSKVLNSLLQQHQCGCVSSASFENSTTGKMTCPNENLPALWRHFRQKLPSFLQTLTIPSTKGFKTTHVQMIYLMLPILNVACLEVDQLLIEKDMMNSLLKWISRFPRANILHCAVSRLFIVCLEDSPFMFGKELPALRKNADPLRLHILKGGACEHLINVAMSATPTSNDEPPGSVLLSLSRGRFLLKYPAVFIDISISFDQAVQNCHTFLPEELISKWTWYRDHVLFPTQSTWEMQQIPSNDTKQKNLIASVDGGTHDIEYSSNSSNSSDSDRSRPPDFVAIQPIRVGEPYGIETQASSVDINAYGSYHYQSETNGGEYYGYYDPAAPTVKDSSYATIKTIKSSSGYYEEDLTEMSDAASRSKNEEHYHIDDMSGMLSISHGGYTAHPGNNTNAEVTPLSALYNEEEKNLIQKFATGVALTQDKFNHGTLTDHD